MLLNQAIADPTADAVDAVPAPRILLLFALQHVLVMYAGAVTVPLVVGRALQLSPQAMATLICADLVGAGIATLIQTLGLPGIGIRLPIMMGVTFVAVSPILAFVDAVGGGPAARLALLPTIYGAVIASGLFGLAIAPLAGRLARFFPATVTGTVILVIGLSLMHIAIDWAAGGQPSSPGYGALPNLSLAAATLAIILLLMKFGRGIFQKGAIMVGVVVGTTIATVTGHTDFTAVANAPWLGLIHPLQFGVPRFDATLSFAMCFVMLVSMIESFGMFLAAGVMVGRPANSHDLTRGLRADAVGTIIGGVLNTFPYTSYAQNIGLLSLTGVRSRFICAAGGVILLALGLCPKLAAIVAAVPLSVLGGAGCMMFGMIAATGVKVLSSVRFTQEQLATIAASLAMGLIPVLSPGFFRFVPLALAPVFHSGIFLSAATAVVLNLLLSGKAGNEPAAVHVP